MCITLEDGFNTLFGDDIRFKLGKFLQAIQTTKCCIHLKLGNLATDAYPDHLCLVLQALQDPNLVNKLELESPSDEYAKAFLVPPLMSFLSQLRVRTIRLNKMRLLLEDGFLEALSANYEITGYHSSEDYYAMFRGGDDIRSKVDEVKSKMEYILLLNCGGRRILKHEPISISLWPLVLERSKRVKVPRFSPYWTDVSEEVMPADIIYHLLRGGVQHLW